MDSRPVNTGAELYLIRSPTVGARTGSVDCLTRERLNSRAKRAKPAKHHWHRCGCLFAVAARCCSDGRQITPFLRRWNLHPLDHLIGKIGCSFPNLGRAVLTAFPSEILRKWGEDAESRLVKSKSLDAANCVLPSVIAAHLDALLVPRS